MISLEQARRDVMERIKAVRAANGMAVIYAMADLGREWRKIEMILDSLPPEPDPPEPLLASDAEIKEALKTSQQLSIEQDVVNG